MEETYEKYLYENHCDDDGKYKILINSNDSSSFVPCDNEEECKRIWSEGETPMGGLPPPSVAKTLEQREEENTDDDEEVRPVPLGETKKKSKRSSKKNSKISISPIKPTSGLCEHEHIRPKGVTFNTAIIKEWKDKSIPGWGDVEEYKNWNQNKSKIAENEKLIQLIDEYKNNSLSEYAYNFNGAYLNITYPDEVIENEKEYDTWKKSVKDYLNCLIENNDEKFIAWHKIKYISELDELKKSIGNSYVSNVLDGNTFKDRFITLIGLKKWIDFEGKRTYDKIKKDLEKLGITEINQYNENYDYNLKNDYRGKNNREGTLHEILGNREYFRKLKKKVDAYIGKGEEIGKNMSIITDYSGINDIDRYNNILSIFGLGVCLLEEDNTFYMLKNDTVFEGQSEFVIKYDKTFYYKYTIITFFMRYKIDDSIIKVKYFCFKEKENDVLCDVFYTFLMKEKNKTSTINSIQIELKEKDETLRDRFKGYIKKKVDEANSNSGLQFSEINSSGDNFEFKIQKEGSGNKFIKGSFGLYEEGKKWVFEFTLTKI